MTDLVNDRATLAAVAELRREFARRGWCEKATGRVIVELLIHLFLAAVGIVIFLACQHWALRVMGILISTYGSMGVGTNTHTSAHYATSTKRWLNEALSYFGFPLFLGVSATFWWHKHVEMHHPTPNVIGVDGDADLLPWFAIMAEDIQASTGWRRFYYLHLQFWLFPLAVAGTCFNMQGQGWVYLLKKLCNSKGRKTSHWIDASAMVLHGALWIGLPLLFWPFSAVAGLYLLRVLLLGYAMYIVLAPGHLPAEAQRTKDEARGEMSFFTLQTEGTVSFRTGFVGRLVCSGLEYQVEHHLFPNISHVYYPRVSQEVQAFCLQQRLSYRSMSWGLALWKSWQVLRVPQQIGRLEPVLAEADSVGRQR
jgi:linoleoyl-CoA desaturase